MKQEHILVTGANGQIGSVLVEYLRGIYGEHKVLATDLRMPVATDSHFEILDATDAIAVATAVKKYKITQIYHLAAILSAKGEENPMRTWDINMSSYFNILEAARAGGVRKIFYPSSIAVFGESVRSGAHQDSYLDPATVYGISKAAGENWSNYYFKKYGLDVRSLRYPGIISHQALPGGGTTDYAVDIYHKAVKGESFECYLKPDTTLPMIYMSDAMDATVRLMEAPADKLTVRTAYNLAAMSFSPAEIAASIQKIFPCFEISYKPDSRQAIAESWPERIDDSAARKDWGWRPVYNLDKMTAEMISALQKKWMVRI